jgi:hypothetical protein
MPCFRLLKQPRPPLPAVHNRGYDAQRRPWRTFRAVTSTWTWSDTRDGTTFLLTVVATTGQQAVKAVAITKPRTDMTTHYNDFSRFLSGLDASKDAAQAATIYRLRRLAHGETYTFKANA